MNRFLSIICFFAVFTFLYSADTSEMFLVHESPAFRFYAEDKQDYSRLYGLIERKTGELEILFDKSLPEPVTFYVYSDWSSFNRKVFSSDDPIGTTTALADHVNGIIYITSPFDNEVRQIKDMEKVIAHEMVHLYFPSSFIFIREGMAEYFSGRNFPVAEEDIPRKFNDMAFYIKGPEETRKAYNASGWMMRYIFEECLPGGLPANREAFAVYAGNPDDYGPLGFSSEQEFFKAFAAYLENQLQP